MFLLIGGVYNHVACYFFSSRFHIYVASIVCGNGWRERVGGDKVVYDYRYFPLQCLRSVNLKKYTVVAK